MTVRIALAQWPIGAPASFEVFAERIRREVGGVAAQGARIVVLPEYLALELAYAFGPEVCADFAASLAAVDGLREAWRTLFAELARRHRIHLLAGTFLERADGGRYRNRAWLFAPDGAAGFQDKLTLTGFEKQAGIIEPGDALRVFETGFGRIGIAVCYDSEFPHYARAQAEAGMRLLLVPSCTDTEAGATRVRVGCMARALENQIYVAQSVTAGVVAWSPALDVNTGRAAVYAPADRGLPDRGIVAEAAPGVTWLLADLDFAPLDAVRAIGQVAGAADWDAQQRPGVLRAAVTRL
ncbi:nitrilase [Mizugakiibacter sediminis]|uniref:Nitrilase n=1 Tax=Mizugakiibacter sediminis TaxID=1475481 RepID=A0A0K8QML5_9GAMM|nr:nitrilase [Mizugakiibacter sediminis]